MCRRRGQGLGRGQHVTLFDVPLRTSGSLFRTRPSRGLVVSSTFACSDPLFFTISPLHVPPSLQLPFSPVRCEHLTMGKGLGCGLRPVDEKSGHIPNLTSSGEACVVGALHTQRPKVTTWDGLKRKLSNQKQFMAGSHVLGPYFSLTKVSLPLD